MAFKSGKQRGWFFEQQKQQGKPSMAQPQQPKPMGQPQAIKPIAPPSFQPQTLQNKINLNHPDLVHIHKMPGMGQIKLTPSPSLPQIPKVQFPKIKKLIK